MSTDVLLRHHLITGIVLEYASCEIRPAGVYVSGVEGFTALVAVNTFQSLPTDRDLSKSPLLIHFTVTIVPIAFVRRRSALVF